MVNDTMRRFGYPESLLAETGYWMILLRPEQPTLGSLVLAAKSEATAFSELVPAAFADLGEVVRCIETKLAEVIRPTRWNYLMLMMVDRHVHFHAIPRYQGDRTLGDISVTDEGWPKAPSLSAARLLTRQEMEALAHVMGKRLRQS